MYICGVQVKPFICTMPMRLDDGWNQIQFNLADFTRRAYGTNYVETLRVQASIMDSTWTIWTLLTTEDVFNMNNRPLNEFSDPRSTDSRKLPHPPCLLLWSAVLWRRAARRIQALPARPGALNLGTWYDIFSNAEVLQTATFFLITSTPQNKPASASASVAGASGPMATAGAVAEGNGSGGGSGGGGGGGEEQEWVG